MLAGYRGRTSEEAMARMGTSLKIKSRSDKAKELRVAHGWFRRFRKGYEKLECSFLVLHQLAAAIIAFRKVRDEINIIYG